MGKKDSPALYEVMTRRSGDGPSRAVNIPKWWQSIKPAMAALRPAVEKHVTDRLSPKKKRKAKAPDTPETLRFLRVVPQADADATEESPTNGRRTLLQLRSGRLEFSLNPVNGAILAGGLLLALFTSYQLGSLWMSSGSEPTVAAGDEASGESIAAVLNSSPKPQVLSPAPSSMLGAQRPSPTRSAEPDQSPRFALAGLRPDAEAPQRQNQPPERKSGLNYVVLESFNAADRDEAIHAGQWLAETQGIATTLETSGRWVQLVGLEGFDYSKPGDKERCHRYIENVKRLGQAYKRAFQGKRTIRYGFLAPVAKRF